LSPATAASLENEITLRSCSRAMPATVLVELPKSGPRISSAPSSIAERAAAAAPSIVPPVSRGSNTMSVRPTSKSAICAASSMSWPTAAALPVSGSSKATLTGPTGKGSMASAGSTGAGSW
jgi:hypothetical protein